MPGPGALFNLVLLLLTCSQAFPIDPFGKNLEGIPRNRSRDFLRDRTPPKVVLARDVISTTSILLWDDPVFMSTH
jgi:hypothetical protein